MSRVCVSVAERKYEEMVQLNTGDYIQLYAAAHRIIKTSVATPRKLNFSV